MNCQRLDFAVEPGRIGAAPRKPVVEGVIDPAAVHPLVGRAVVDIDRIGRVARGHQMKIGLAFETELGPCLAVVVAADQTKWVLKSGFGRRMPTAVERLLGRGEPHVVVLRTGCFRPAPCAIDCEPLMAWNHELLAIGAEGKAMHVHERNAGLRARGRAEGRQNVVRRIRPWASWCCTCRTDRRERSSLAGSGSGSAAALTMIQRMNRSAGMPRSAAY